MKYSKRLIAVKPSWIHYTSTDVVDEILDALENGGPAEKYLLA